MIYENNVIKSIVMTMKGLGQRTLTIGGIITVPQLVSNLTRLELTNKENMSLFDVVKQLNPYL